MTPSPTETVKLWHEALNAGDHDRLLALSSDDVEVGGPRGSGRGSALLAEWFGRAGITIVPLQYFARGSAVVVDQNATWHIPGSEGPAGPQRVASAFTVRGGQVASVIRFPTLDEALNTAGLTRQDRVSS